VSNDEINKPDLEEIEPSEIEQAEVQQETTEDEKVPSVEESLVVAQSDLQGAREDVLRAQAELQNMRRRCERDVENAHKFALEKFVNELLPVVDNLERAIAACDDTHAKVVEGLELTLKGFQGVLQKFKVVAVDPEGEPFNPELHQAMSMVPNPDMENNLVMTCFQKGYTLNGRLVRPAMVVVVKNRQDSKTGHLSEH
jgi:molecular chaperone GrpE